MKTADTPSTATVAANLEDALADLAQQREALAQITREYAAEKARLQVLEDLDLLGDTIDGKNAAIRRAQLRQTTEAQRTAFQAVELQRVVASMGVDMALDRLKTYRALAILIAGNGE
jgi:hypothetical protein